MQSCTISAITTHLMGNAQGGYYFISLDTGCHISCRKWISLQMPAEFLKRVNCLACHAKSKCNLTFTNSNNGDLDVLYANTTSNDDDKPNHNDDTMPELAGVDDDSNSDDDSYDKEDDQWR